MRIKDEKAGHDSPSPISRVRSDSNNHRGKLDSTSAISRLINILDIEFENWKWICTLAVMWLFFFALLPFPTIIFAGEFYPLSYIWLVGWLCVFILLEHARDVRKGKAKASVKWRSYPNAIEDYCDTVIKKRKITSQ